MTARVEPPAEHRGVRWHWLAWKDGPMRPAMWCAPITQTDSSVWVMLSAFGSGFKTPAEAAVAGYRYVAPCIPPEPSDG